MEEIEVFKDILKYCALPAASASIWFWLFSHSEEEQHRMRHFMIAHGPVIGVLGMTAFAVEQILVPGSTTGPFSLIFISLFGGLSISHEQLVRFNAEVSKWAVILIFALGIFLGQAPQVSSDKEIKKIKERLCILEGKRLTREECLDKITK